MTFETINEDRHDWCDDPNCEICLERRYAQDPVLIDDEDEYRDDIQQQYRMC